jgi:hypothetical protein
MHFPVRDPTKKFGAGGKIIDKVAQEETIKHFDQAVRVCVCVCEYVSM